MAAVAQTSAAALTTTRVASGIFFHAGHQAEETARNHGDIANIGFIIGSRCVAVVDTGGSPWVGRNLLAAIRERTQRPVCYVINTHMHPDHVMGNRVFARRTHARFVANGRLATSLAARATAYLRSLSRELDEDADASWIVLPDIAVDGQLTLDLGGRSIVLQAWPTAHTDNDLTVYDEKTRTLCAGDLLFVNRIPSIDGSLAGWLKVLGTLANRDDVSRVIPGHGPLVPPWRQAIAKEKHYLVTLRDGVRQVLADGQTIEYASRHIGRDQRKNWLLFNNYNARNVIAAYTEQEWQ